MNRAVWRGILGVVLTIMEAQAQAPPEPKYGYEVVAVKKADPKGGGTRIAPGANGGLRVTNATLLSLLMFAYDVRDYQIVGAPAWATSEVFDVNFTPYRPEGLPKPGEADAKSMDEMMDRQRQRLQAVLRDRFGVKLHMETRERSVYALLPAKPGVALKAAEGKTRNPSMKSNIEKGELVGISVNMRMVTNILANALKRPVVDETGVDRSFDIKLQWSPDVPAAGPPSDGATADNGRPSIFTALKEQAGLRLESKKGPVTIYAVDRAERPTAN